MLKGTIFTMLALCAGTALFLQPGSGTTDGTVLASRVTASELRLISQIREMASPPPDTRTVVAYAPRTATPAAAPAPVQQQPAEAAAEKLVVAADALNLRNGPSNAADVLGRLTAGQTVVVAGREAGWVQVAVADGTTGWAYGAYLAPSTN